MKGFKLILLYLTIGKEGVQNLGKIWTSPRSIIIKNKVDYVKFDKKLAWEIVRVLFFKVLLILQTKICKRKN